MTGRNGALGGARARIDRIDASLLRLLNERASVVRDLHARKSRAERRIYDPARTDAILDRLLRLNRGPLRDDQVREIFAFLLHHFALEHRPAAARPPDPLLLVAGPDRPAGPERLRQLALSLRRHGIRFLRLPRPVEASDLSAARQLCDAHGLRLVLPGGPEVAAIADVVEGPREGIPRLAECRKAVLIPEPGKPRSAGMRDALLVEPARKRGKLVAARTRGAIFLLSDDEDEEALANFCHRAALLRLALLPWPGASGGAR